MRAIYGKVRSLLNDYMLVSGLSRNESQIRRDRDRNSVEIAFGCYRICAPFQKTQDRNRHTIFLRCTSCYCWAKAKPKKPKKFDAA